MIYAYIRIQIVVEIKTIIVVPVPVLPVRVLLVQSSPVLEIPYAAKFSTTSQKCTQRVLRFPVFTISSHSIGQNTLVVS